MPEFTIFLTGNLLFAEEKAGSRTHAVQAEKEEAGRADGDIGPYKGTREKEKRGSDGVCRSHGVLPYGRKGETEFRRKFFCLLFFQEKEGREVMRTTMAVRSSVACWGLLAMRSRASSLGLSPLNCRNRSRSHWSS